MKSIYNVLRAVCFAGILIVVFVTKRNDGNDVAVVSVYLNSSPRVLKFLLDFLYCE